MSPVALGHVEVSHSSVGVVDWSHHQIGAQHELILDGLHLGVVFELNQERSERSHASLLILFHELQFVVLERFVDVDKLGEELQGFGIIPNLVHFLWLDANVRPHYHVRKSVGFNPALQQLFTSCVLVQSVEIVYGRVAAYV